MVSVNVYDRPSWWGLGDFRGAGASSLSGEAVTVDLGNGRYLFALLSNYSHETARETFISKEEQPRTKAQVIAVYDRLEKMRSSRELAREYYPSLVTFDDINDPATSAASIPAISRPVSARLSAQCDYPVDYGRAGNRGRVEKLLGWLSITLSDPQKTNRRPNSCKQCRKWRLQEMNANNLHLNRRCLHKGAW